LGRQRNSTAMKTLTGKFIYMGLDIMTVLLFVNLALSRLVFPQPPIFTQTGYAALFPFQGRYAKF